MANIGPVFGWDAPHKTSTTCDDPEFADEYVHRVYIVPVEFYVQGTPGFRTKKKCVGCGELFEHEFFYPLGDVQETYSDVLEELGFNHEEWVEQRDPDNDPKEITTYRGEVSVDYEELGSSGRASPDESEIIDRLENALKLIEQFAQDAGMIKNPSGVLERIYQIAHAARAPRCLDAHTDWEETFQELMDQHLNEEPPEFSENERCVHCDKIIIGDPGYHHATEHPDQPYNPTWYMDETDELESLKEAVSD